MEMGYSCAGWFLIWFHKILRNSQRHCRLCRKVEKLCDIRHLEHKVCLRKFEILQMILGWKKRENKFDIILGSLIPEKKLYVLYCIFFRMNTTYIGRNEFPEVFPIMINSGARIQGSGVTWINEDFYIFIIFDDFLKVDMLFKNSYKSFKYLKKPPVQLHSINFRYFQIPGTSTSFPNIYVHIYSVDSLPLKVNIQ